MNDAMRPATVELLARFREVRRPLGVLPEMDRRLLGLLAEIEHEAEPEAVLWLWPAMEGRSRAVRRRALAVMTSLLNKATSMQVLEILESLLARSCGPDYDRWRRFSAADVVVLQQELPHAVGLLVLLTVHSSGWVRELALRALIGRTDRCILPVLRDRLNDWVPQVREQAGKVFSAFLQPEHAQLLVEVLPLFVVLDRRGRADHSPTQAAIRRVLLLPKSRSALRNELSSPSREIRCFCFELLIAAEGPNDALITAGLAAREPAIRAMASRAVLQIPVEHPIDGHLAAMLASGDRPLRQVALEVLAARQGVRAVPTFVSHLFDRSPTLREYARFYLAKFSAPVVPRTMYRDTIRTGGASLVPAIDGLAETGVAEDADLILPMMEHRRVRVRLAALRTFSRLHPDRGMPALLDALDATSARIRRFAMLELTRRRNDLDVGGLVARFEAAGPHGRVALVHLLASFQATRSLEPLFTIAIGRDDEAKVVAEMALLGHLRAILHPFLEARSAEVEWLAQRCRDIPVALAGRIQRLVRERTRLRFGLDVRLDRLVRAFNDAQRHVVAVLEGRLGVRRPVDCGQWTGMYADVRRAAQAQGLYLYPHGYGLAFKDNVLWIDFDFGSEGEIDGFDASRLYQFGVQRGTTEGFVSAEEVRAAIDDAMRHGELRYSGYLNYYRSDSTARGGG